MQFTTNHIVKAYFVNSAEKRIEFSGKVIRVYLIQGVVPMVEVDTPDGSMHAQQVNTQITGTFKLLKRKPAAVGTRTKVRANAISEGMTILVSRQSLLGESALMADHRITRATAAKVTGGVTYALREGFRKSSRFYTIPTTEGDMVVSSTQTITVVHN